MKGPLLKLNNGVEMPAFGLGVYQFTPDEIKELNASLPDIHVQGQRLPAGVLALSGVEAPPKL